MLPRFLLCLVFFAIPLAPLRLHATTLVVEAAQLEFLGGWEVNGMPKGKEVRTYLVAGPHARQTPAAGAIQLPHGGPWRLWVRSKDFPKDRPGTRSFSVRLGSTRSATVFGKHGQADLDGWAWEDGGKLELPAGPTLIVLGDEVTSTARCDAIVLTDNFAYRPEGVPWLLAKTKAEKVPLKIRPESERSFSPEPLTSVANEAQAMLQNESVRLTFHSAQTATGPAIALRAAVHDGELWLPMKEDAGVEGYRVLYRPRESDPKLTRRGVNPRWDTSLSPLIAATAGEAEVKTRTGIETAPWLSARCFPLRPTAVHQRDATTVELTFPDTAAGKLTATWHLAAQHADAEVSLHFQPAHAGHYSLGYHGPLAAAPEQTDFMLLPFMYHGHRFPEQPNTLLSSSTPTPLTLVNRQGLSCALVADPSSIPFEWPSVDNARYALALRNESGLAQPMIYTPVLGEPGSVSDGSAVEGKFHLWLQRGDWYAAYRRIADEMFHLTDYRRPVQASLSDAALNLMDLMRDEQASGWDPRAKGPWNIESRNTVTQSSPLVYLSCYLLTGDEDFYNRIARPSLEFMLSRPSPHFATEPEISDNYYHHQPMKGPASLYGAISFASAYAMTQGKTAAFGELCLDGKGNARVTAKHGHVQSFEDPLALYELTGEKRWLDAAVAGADQYIAANLTKLPSKDLGPVPFVNVSFVPDWEGLQHLYAVTGEKRFLQAATEGAHWLLTTLWTQPLIPQGDTTIHPEGVFLTSRHLWWWGNHLYRRGVAEGPAGVETLPYPPPVRLPEQHVPAWEVSQVGLGLEQPETYSRIGPRANIMMDVWAPALLRLASASGDEAFRTAARNAVIGRFANYPGYYLDGMTNAYQQADYIRKGPDVTSFYVHHIPSFAGYVLDYLFSDAEIRSKGAVTFPWVRSCGYVWFDSRLYGHAPGKIYGQTAWPWLHRTAASVDTVNVDRVLAHGDGKFHVVLMNQVHEPQKVHVRFDEKVLGRSVEGAPLQAWMDNQPGAPVTVKNGSAEVELKPLGLCVLTLDGVKIDVPTHRTTSSPKLSLPTKPGLIRTPIPGTQLEAIGTVLEVPPFDHRDLYVYVTAQLGECRSAVLHYKVGDEPEQTLKQEAFPWEFSVKLPPRTTPVTWRVDVQMADHK